MQKIELSELKEKGIYIVESPRPLGRSGAIAIPSNNPKTESYDDLRDELEMRFSVLIKIIKIELPFTIVEINERKSFVRLSDTYEYFEPSASFLRSVKNKCERY